MSISDDRITGKSGKKYSPDFYRQWPFKEDFENVICVFCISKPINGQFVRKYTHAGYYKKMNQEVAETIEHKGANWMFCYFIQSEKDEEEKIVKDINDNSELFYNPT